MNKNRFIVDPYKTAIALATSIGCIALGIAVATIGRYVSMAVFFAIAALFLWVLYINGSTVTLLDDGVELAFLGHRRKFFKWEDIQEVGCAGTKIIRQKDKNDVGSCNIYFSETAMDDDERHQMLFKWPPKDKIYMLYIAERLEAVQYAWSGRIIFYNSGKVHF